MSLVGFVQCQNGEIQQKIFVRFGGFVVWGFTFRGLELYFSWFGALLFGVWDFTFCGFEVGFVVWNYFLGRNGGEIGKKCVTLHFDELKPPKKYTQ